MAAGSSKIGGARRGMALGLAATLIVVALHWTEAFAPAERGALDLRFRWLPRLGARGDIVHVDLDDNAIEQVGRWPWPRRQLGRLIDTLNECGARLVALDVLLPNPQPPRYVKEGVTDLYLDDASGQLNRQAAPTCVLDDLELAEAVDRSAGLFLAVSLDLTAPAAAEQHSLPRRLWALLENDPALSRRDAAERLLGEGDPRSDAGDRLRREYLRQRAMRAVEGLALPVEAFAGLDLPPGRSRRPPLVAFAQAAEHAGCVAYQPDPGGGVRRVPLAVRIGQRALPQLALALAAEALDRDCEISAAGRQVVLTCGGRPARSIPVDQRGFMLVNWTRDGDPRWGGRHISAVAVADVWQARERLRRNSRARYVACAELAGLVAYEFEQRPLSELFDEVNQNWAQLQDARRQRYAAMLFAPGRAAEVQELELAPRRREAELERRLDRGCRELIAFIDEQLQAADQAGGEGDETERKVRRLRSLIKQVDDAAGGIQESLTEARRRLRAEVNGKIVLFGSVSTGAADFVPTALDERTPGVVVHGQALNTILSGKFVRQSGPWLSAVLVLAAGALITAVAATRGPVASSLVLILAAGAYAGAGVAVWAAWTYWVVTAGPVAAMLAAFAVVTAYRQLTEQRHKRQIISTWKQTLSPAMVDLLVSDPTRAALGGQRRQVSSLFSDLAGFTSLAERLGPEATVELLNRYLDRVGETIRVRHDGTLSKYEGDAVFAFFGAPVAQPDHAARALAAALDCQAFLPEFNRRIRDEEGLLPDWVQLSVRIGITSGEALVGWMGSAQKKSYTAIGDTVNLAARLEAANKFFGTRILANEAAWSAGADGLVGRPLGRLLVVGKSEPVAVWEPLARDQQADDELRTLIQDFTRGVERYAAGDFQAARESFLAIIARTDDAPARAYLNLCGQAINEPPDAADFDGVIRLTEK